MEAQFRRRAIFFSHVAHNMTATSRVVRRHDSALAFALAVMVTMLVVAREPFITSKLPISESSDPTRSTRVGYDGSGGFFLFEKMPYAAARRLDGALGLVVEAHAHSSERDRTCDSLDITLTQTTTNAERRLCATAT
jgi:hypothetical protein